MRPTSTPTTMLLAAALLAGCSHAFLAPVHRHLASSPNSGVVSVVRGRGAAAAVAPTTLGQQQRRHRFLLTGGARPLRAMLDTKEPQQNEEEEEEAKQAIVDQKAQQEFERLLASGDDLLGLVDHLRKHQGGIKPTWEQVCVGSY